MSFHEQKLRSLEKRVDQLSQEVDRKMNTRKLGAGVCLFKPKKKGLPACPKGWHQAGHALFGGLELNKGHDPTNFCVYKDSQSCPSGFKKTPIGTLGNIDGKGKHGAMCKVQGTCKEVTNQKGYKHYTSIDISDYINTYTK